MRVLIYSDVHANWEAMAAVLEAAGGRYQATVCLGDVVGYGGSPNPAGDWVRAHTPTVVRGNHDRACASLDGIAWFNPAAAAAARWTHHTLSPENTAWLRALPAGPVEAREMGPEHRLVHGSPLDEDEYLVEPAQAAACFAATSAPAHWFGHTHLQGGFALADEVVSALPTAAERHTGPRAGAAAVRFQLRAGARYLINPGSVGQPRDLDWRAAFAMLDTESGEVELHRVPYDLAGAQAQILEAGLPPRLAQRLAAGR